MTQIDMFDQLEIRKVSDDTYDTVYEGTYHKDPNLVPTIIERGNLIGESDEEIERFGGPFAAFVFDESNESDHDIVDREYFKTLNEAKKYLEFMLT